MDRWYGKGGIVARSITVEVSGEGKMHVEYDGFPGTACFNAASELQTYLQSFGIDVEVIQVDPKKDEVEVRRLENQAKVGSGG